MPQAVLDELSAALGRSGNSRGLMRLGLRIHSEQASKLPWELTTIPCPGLASRFLALDPRVRLFRLAKNEPIPSDQPHVLRVLIAWSDPGTEQFGRLAGLDGEIRAVISALSLRKSDQVELQLVSSATPQSIHRQLVDFKPHVFHFAGHGVDLPTGSGLICNGADVGTHSVLRTSNLVRWLNATQIKLVVLSACDQLSAAQQLADEGIPLVVATQLPVVDVVQTEAMRMLYGATAQGTTIEDAVSSIRTAFRATPADWGSMVLFGTGSICKLPVEPDRHVMGGAAALPVARLIGRKREREALGRMLAQGIRIITITGVGGIGKTRIAKQVSIDQAPYFSGVWTVESEALGSPSDLPAAIARAGGLASAPGIGFKEMAAHVGERRLLIVIDGVETLVSRSFALMLERIAETLPSCSFLLTSRRKVGAATEAAFELTGLDSTSDAVALLCEAAEVSASPEDQEYRAVLTDICRTLEGLPLAILIAGGRLKDVGAYELRDLLRSSRLRILLSRRNSLFEVLKASIELLTTEQVTLLGNLAVFAGGFFLPQASDVLQVDRIDLLDGISQLRSHCLLEIRMVGEKTRYSLLDSVRDCILELSPVVEPVRANHGAEMIKIASQAANLFREGAWTEASNLLWLEISNFRYAFDYLGKNGGDAQVAEYAGSLCRALFEAGMWDDFDRLADAGLTAAGRVVNSKISIELLGLKGARMRRSAREEEATEVWLQRIDLCKGERFQWSRIDTLTDLSQQSLELGRLAEAYRYASKARRSALRCGISDLVANSTTLQAEVLLVAGHIGAAKKKAQIAKDVLTHVQDRDVRLYTEKALARIYRSLGDYAAAENLLVGMLSLAIEGRRTFPMGWALLELSRLYREKHCTREAILCAAAAHKAHQNTNSNLKQASDALLAELRLEIQDSPLERVLFDAQLLPFVQLVHHILQTIQIFDSNLR